MKTKLENLDISNSAKAVVRDVLKTRNLPTLCLFVKAALANRADEEAELNFDKVGDKKSRARAQRVCRAIAGLDEPKAVSVVCATAINQRKASRAKAAE